MIGIATEGYVYSKLPMLFRPIVFVGAILLITESVYQDFIGLAIFVLLIIF
nr:hypothetical protein [Sedimentibacter sp.]